MPTAWIEFVEPGWCRMDETTAQIHEILYANVGVASDASWRHTGPPFRSGLTGIVHRRMGKDLSAWRCSACRRTRRSGIWVPGPLAWGGEGAGSLRTVDSGPAMAYPRRHGADALEGRFVRLQPP